MSADAERQPTLDEARAVADPPYSADRSRQIAREIFWADRDPEAYVCPDCGRGQDRVNRFEAHHIDGDPYNNEPANLAGLCDRCHVWRHRTGPTLPGLDLEEWKAEFLAIGREGP